MVVVVGAVAGVVGAWERQRRLPVLSAHCTGQSTAQKSTSSNTMMRARRCQSPQRDQQRARRPRRRTGPSTGVGAGSSGGLLRPTSTLTQPGSGRPGAAGGGRQHSRVPSSHTGSSRRRCAGNLACSWWLVRSAGAPDSGKAVGCRQKGQGTASPPGPGGCAAASRARHSRQKTWVQASSLGVLKRLS